MVKLAAGALVALLAGALLAFGPTRDFSGVYTSSFEHSEFDGCWVNFSPEASKRFHALVPGADKYEATRAQVHFSGRSTARLKNVSGGKGYGHVGAYPCEIEVIELKSARSLGAAR